MMGVGGGMLVYLEESLKLFVALARDSAFPEVGDGRRALSLSCDRAEASDACPHGALCAPLLSGSVPPPGVGPFGRAWFGLGYALAVRGFVFVSHVEHPHLTPIL